MKKRLLAAAVSGMLVLTAVAAWAETPLEDTKSRESYTLGYQFGSGIRQQGIEVDRDLLIRALTSGLNGEDAALGPEEMRDVLEKLNQQMAANEQRTMRELALRNLMQGREFLEANAKKEGVRTLPDGLQYRIIREGTGPMPTADDLVTVHYIASFVDGTEFDNTYTRNKPATVKLETIIPGWREALPMMKTGSRWQIFMPAELAYGEQAAGPIGPNSALVFEIELLSVGAENAPSIPMPKDAEK